MKFAYMTDKGIVRSSNEDACEAGALDENFTWGIVCDGMGGAMAGEIASQIAVSFIGERIQNAYRRDMSARSARYLLESAVIAAGILVYNDGEKNPAHFGMGTTVVVAIALKDSVVCAYVGDSRAYLVDNDNICQITHDHSLVQQRIDAGLLTEEEAMYSPDRNIITRALGAEEIVKVDIVSVPFEKGDKLLLCSDGLSNMLSSRKIRMTMNEAGTADLPAQLIQCANFAGGRDNISAVVIER